MSAWFSSAYGVLKPQVGASDHAGHGALGGEALHGGERSPQGRRGAVATHQLSRLLDIRHKDGIELDN